MVLAIDAAATELYEGGRYRLPREGVTYTATELVDLWERWCRE